MKAALPANETERLAALHRYGVLDTAAERDFDDITLLASHICGTPIALISLVDRDRQWFKSRHGTTTAETPRDIAFCAHGILQSGVFEVGDALADERFANNPLVTGASKLRFYAGAPLVTPDGQAVGMLCVNDQVPRELSPEQKKALQALGRQVVAQMELRSHVKELHHRIEERNAAEAAVRTSEEKFRQLAANISDLFWMTSPDLQQILYLSPAYERIWGRPVERLYAQPRAWIDDIHPGDREKAVAAMTTLVNGEASAEMEFRVVQPGGDVRWIMNRGFRVRDAAGQVIRLAGIATDVTEHKIAQAALARAHEELITISRLAGMAEVATGVLHNVGNVLNSLNVSASVIAASVRQSKTDTLGKLAALLAEHQDDLAAFLTGDPKGRRVPELLQSLARHSVEERDRLLREIDSLQENVDHIRSIVTMQQTYATAASMAEPLDAGRLMEDALRLQKDVLQHQAVRIERAFQATAPVMAEKAKVLQVLVNLIGNARQACTEGGASPKVITLAVEPAGGRVRLTVRDNGIGIAPENLTRIFAHGFTTKATGHGFGLHSAANAAKEMKGSLTAASAGPGLGATFILELPLARPAATRVPVIAREPAGRR